MEYVMALVIDNAEQLVVVDELDPKVDDAFRQHNDFVQRQTCIFSAARAGIKVKFHQGVAKEGEAGQQVADEGYWCPAMVVAG